MITDEQGIVGTKQEEAGTLLPRSPGSLPWAET